MRHFLYSRAVAALPIGVGKTPATAVLVTLTSDPLRVTPRPGRAIDGTVTVATVAMTADHNPRSAAPTKILTAIVLPSPWCRPSAPFCRTPSWTNVGNR